MYFACWKLVMGNHNKIISKNLFRSLGIFTSIAACGNVNNISNDKIKSENVKGKEDIEKAFGELLTLSDKIDNSVFLESLKKIKFPDNIEINSLLSFIDNLNTNLGFFMSYKFVFENVSTNVSGERIKFSFRRLDEWSFPCIFCLCIY